MNRIQNQPPESLNEFTAFVRKQPADLELAANALQDGLPKALKAKENVRDGRSAKERKPLWIVTSTTSVMAPNK